MCGLCMELMVGGVRSTGRVGVATDEGSQHCGEFIAGKNLAITMGVRDFYGIVMVFKLVCRGYSGHLRILQA